MADGPRVWAATDVGLLRPNNEDRFAVAGHISTSADERWEGYMPADGGWVLIADGMGGHGAGEVASELAIGVLAQRLDECVDVETLPDLIQEASDRVHGAMFTPPGRPGMGTTIVGALVQRGTCTFFNVGDSRAYLFREGTLQRCSRDHTPEHHRGSQHRSHALTQSLGGTISRLRMSPHIVRLPACPGDLLLLCSDGLTDLVRENEIGRLLLRSPQNPASALVDRALAAGGRDNVTVAVVAL